MVRIETDLIVAEDGTATIRIQVPPEVAPGEHKAVIQIDGQSSQQTAPSKITFSAHDVGPWPEGLTFSRDQIYDDDGR